MKNITMVLAVFILLILSACQSQSIQTPSSSTPGVQATLISTPDQNTMTLKGRLLSSVDGKPYANTAVQLAGVYRNGETAAYALDTARSPGSYTDEEGYFVIPGVIYKEFVIVVGNPEDKYFIVNDSNDMARVYQSEMGKIQEIGELTIDFAP